ncbi:MAG: major capsid protein [Chloroflexota bacterium]
MLNPFDNDAFSLVEMTRAINLLPTRTNIFQTLGMFPERGVTTRTVVVEEMSGVLSLLPSLPVGAPGTQPKFGKRKVRSFTIPHIPVEFPLSPSDYESVRVFGSGSQVEALMEKMQRQLADIRRKLEATIEYLQAGALKGIILDADGSVLYNLYGEFGITPKTINFELDKDTTNVRNKCREVLRHIDQNLMGDVSTGVTALVSPEFWDALQSHKSVREYFLAAARSMDDTRQRIQDGFFFGGVTFVEYHRTATTVTGTPVRYIEENEGHAFPVGTLETFETLYAPADFIETVNTIGMPFYAKQASRKFERGVDIHAQTNPLPICYRPGVLVKLTAK